MDYEDFKRRADAVRSRIGEACVRSGRKPDEVELLAVTKSHPVEAAVFAARYYGLPEPLGAEAFAELAERWRPFRTWAAVLIRLAGTRGTTI